jgi:hypothetical protein
MPHLRRDGAMVPRRDEGQPPQNGGDGDYVDDGPWLGLIQLLRSALTRLPPPGGGIPTADQNLKFTLSFNFVCTKKQSLCVVCTLFTLSYSHLQPGA